MAVLGSIFYAALRSSDQTSAPAQYTDALISTLPWQVVAYLAAAALMVLLPTQARPEHP